MECTEEKQVIESLKNKLDNAEDSWYWEEDIQTLLNILEKRQKENEKAYLQGFNDSEEKYSTVIADNMKKDEIINKAINEIEYLRQYFSEDLQPDFIRILEILKDKKVIDW